MKELVELIDKIKNKDIEIKPDTKLFKEKIINSINILDLIGFVEQKIGRKLTSDEIVMKNFQDIESIKRFFE